MVTGSTSDTLSTERRDGIAEQYAIELFSLHPDGPPELVVEALQERMRDMKDTEVWRIAMMIGYFNEDGEDR